MKVLIIEDEPATARRLNKLISEVIPDATIEGPIETVEECVDFFKTNIEPDLVFMDIQLPDGTSFDIFKHINLQCPIIFTTAFDQYAVQAFKVNSIDYLLKPVKKEDLVAALNKYLTRNTAQSFPALNYSELGSIVNQKETQILKRLVIRIGGNIKAFLIEDASYFFVEQKSVSVMLRDGRKYPIDFSLHQLEEMLNPEQYFRINRWMIISFQSIESMFSYSKSRIKITLTPPFDQETITSTERSGAFKEWLKGK